MGKKKREINQIKHRFNFLNNMASRSHFTLKFKIESSILYKECADILFQIL